ncbi:HET-domain-containing protein [Lojkania enalia]|uniref:HET-domain-containing protein n=1 Tax=Lojkania enalia TaxID=147567 RepID=A0A9P4KDA8_9PLEO|nr:HET-domain-containing protein [Didymosphaeria enalia]
MSDFDRTQPRSKPNRIRLVRLIPSEDETATIHCELFDYSIRDFPNKTHLYEALSYVWGHQDEVLPIYVNGRLSNVRKNLHAALRRLRNHCMERILWIDALSINQEDTREKEMHIQFMANIYGYANRVIVWLGEEADNSTEALESIRAVADDDPRALLRDNQSMVRFEWNQKAFFKLLDRPWFKRMWVLQEVAAARSILIMCGSTEVNGYVFCLGLSTLELAFPVDPELHGLIRPVTYLIRRAGTRPAYTANSPNGASLGELLDMYHTRESTERHDKVYALYGMSSNDPSAAGLSPNYGTPWRILLLKVVKYVLSKEVYVETWDERELAVIKSKGCILGQISKIESDRTRYDKQHVTIKFGTPTGKLFETAWGTKWPLQASAKAVRERDLLCLLRGASKPSIIRACKDHFSLIMVGVSPRHLPLIDFERQDKFLLSAENFPRNFLLVWDLGRFEMSQVQAGFEFMSDINTFVPIYLRDMPRRVSAIHEVALILRDSEMHKEAETRLEEAVEKASEAFGRDATLTLACMDELAMVYNDLLKSTEAKKLVLQIIETRKRVQGLYHQYTLNSIANLVLFDLYPKLLTVDIMARMKDLVGGIRRNSNITEEDVVALIGSIEKETLTILLGLENFRSQITERVVKAAAMSDSNGTEVMILLLDLFGNSIITEEVVKAAARNLDKDTGEMKLLLDRGEDQIILTEKVVKAAAGND